MNSDCENHPKIKTTKSFSGLFTASCTECGQSASGKTSAEAVDNLCKGKKANIVHNVHQIEDLNEDNPNFS